MMMLPGEQTAHPTSPPGNSSITEAELSFCSSISVFTFRVCECDLLAPPQAQISPLELLRHQSVELQSGTKPGADLGGGGRRTD